MQVPHDVPGSRPRRPPAYLNEYFVGAIFPAPPTKLIHTPPCFFQTNSRFMNRGPISARGHVARSARSCSARPPAKQKNNARDSASRLPTQHAPSREPRTYPLEQWFVRHRHHIEAIPWLVFLLLVPCCVRNVVFTTVKQLLPTLVCATGVCVVIATCPT